jgi:hypothetical protein
VQEVAMVANADEAGKTHVIRTDGTERPKGTRQPSVLMLEHQ